MILAQEDAEYMGTLSKIRIVPARSLMADVHEQDSYDISLQQWLAIILTNANYCWPVPGSMYSSPL